MKTKDMDDVSKRLADILFPESRVKEFEMLDIPPEQRKLHTETYDFSVSTIFEYLTTDKIVIPTFQRNYVWNRTQASRLIESLIIQCPIPVLYFSQTEDERFSVIDGNQRLTTLKLFLNNDFELSGLTTYPELNGSTFSSLDPRFQRHINNRTLRCIVILKETHPQIKFDVFERLNTGSVKLNAQELRHGIYHGTLVDLIEELSKEKLFQELTQTKNDTRMKCDELILRYFALANSWNNYSNPFVTYLNTFSENNRNLNNSSISTLKLSFLNTYNKTYQIFGDLSFKVFEKEGKKIRFNAALYDAEMIAIKELNLTDNQIEGINKDRLTDGLIELFNNDDFYKYITAATTNTNSVKNRIRMFIDFLQQFI
jgi:hypothetical protein